MKDKLHSCGRLRTAPWIIALLLLVPFSFAAEPTAPLKSPALDHGAVAKDVQVQTASKSAAPLPSGKLSQTAKPAPAPVTLSIDQQLQRKVRRSLIDNPRTRSFGSQALVQNQRATLVGQTYFRSDRELAERTVAKLPGVLAVRNLIVVAPNADLEIAQKLHEAFSSDLIVDDGAIAVTVIHGKVYLSGMAVSAEQLARVNQLAFGIPGVVAVSNGLKLDPTSKSALIRRPAVGGSYSTYRPPYR